MPSPYKTNCFNYNEFGCKSRRDCIDQCNVKWALINCNGSLPNDTFINRHNDKDKFGNECDDKHKEYCEHKYKSPDCFNEYYTIKLIDKKIFKNFLAEKEINEYFEYCNETIYKSSKTKIEANANLISYVYIQINNEPDTIYIHSPQQYPIEFICFIGGVISLWTGFSVLSMYGFRKRFFGRKQNRNEEIKLVNVNAINNKKINKNNNIILETKLNKLMNVMKIREKNHVIKVTPDNNV